LLPEIANSNAASQGALGAGEPHYHKRSKQYTDRNYGSVEPPPLNSVESVPLIKPIKHKALKSRAIRNASTNEPTVAPSAH